MKITWKTIPGKYGSRDAYHLDKVEVGTCGWNASKSKGDVGVDYSWRMHLCGLADFNKHGTAPSMESAHAKVEEITRFWLTQIGVK